MKIEFCDLCNESVPLSDLEAGRAVRVKGRVVCSRCEQIMHGPNAPGPIGLPLESSAPAIPMGALAHGAPSVASIHPRASGALALAAFALLCALGVGYWLNDRAEQGTRAQEQALADLRGELGELRSRNAALSSSLGQRADQDRQAFDQKLSASQQQIEGLVAGARQDTQAVAGRLADLDQRLAALQAPGSSDERQDAQLKQVQQQIAQVAKEVEDLGRALADVATEHATALAAAAQPVPTQPAWMGLLSDLSSSDESLRWRAVLSLGETRDPAVSAYLLPVLKDEDIFVRMAAARTLGDLRAPEAVAALIDALGDPEPSVREAVYAALKAITKRELAFDALGGDGEQRARQIQAWRDWWAKEQARQGG